MDTKYRFHLRELIGKDLIRGRSVGEKCREKARSGHGFTLVEMLVAVAILSILSLLLMVILNQVSAGWSLVQSQIDARQNGRAILTLMASDLRPAALPTDRTNTNNLQFVVDPPVLTAASGYLYPHAFFWQAPIATSTTFGTMAEVGYFIRWDTSKVGNPRAFLCRLFVNPPNPRVASSYIYAQPTAWLTTSILDSTAPGTMASAYQGWVADNVIGLWVRCLDANGLPITQDSGSTENGSPATVNYAFDSRKGYTTANGVMKSGIYDASSQTFQLWTTLPSYVEIAVVVIDARGASRITTIPTYASTDPTKFWSEIQTFMSSLPAGVSNRARVYSTRVQMSNGG